MSYKRGAPLVPVTQTLQKGLCRPSSHRNDLVSDVTMVGVTASTLNLQVSFHPDDTAAGVAGLVRGDVYADASGSLRVKL